jgi:16S rRNA (cytosine1407-C5)-methyltransferase
MAKKRNRSQPQPQTNPVDDALARFRPLLDDAGYQAMLDELQRPLHTSIRANPLKVDPERAIQHWRARYGWQVEPVPYCPTGWWVTESATQPSQTLEHRLGEFYIQDAASMLPVELFDFDGLERPLILDMAASPGGKTTHLAARSGDRGLILANDSSQGRIPALRIVLEQWGAVNSAVSRFPGEQFGAWYPDVFDRVLLDAPCSMQGLRSTEAHPMRAITEKEQSALAQRQTRLLESALQAVKIGGQVVYSTCTLAVEEDEAVLDALMRQHPGCFEIANLSSRLPAPAPALSEASGQTFDPAVRGAARLWPHTFGTSGFFAALLTKLRPLPGETAEPPQRPFERSGLEPLKKQEAYDLTLLLKQQYGFDLEPVLLEQDLALYRRGKSVLAVPDLFLTTFRGLPVQSLGLEVGEELPNTFSPAHDWVARYAARFNANRLRLPQELIPAWLRGEDARGFETQNFAKGLVVIVEDEDGRFLGRGKLVQDRLRNLLPRKALVG